MSNPERSDSLGRARDAIDEAERLQREHVRPNIYPDSRVIASIFTLQTIAVRELLEVVELHDLEREG